MRKGECYLDEDAAKLKKGQKEKDELTSSPFYVEFEYVAQHKGYWTYDHFVLQCKDVVDCVKVLYPQFEFHLCVDHSCGHNRQRDDGLNASKMNKNYGGKQRIPHDSKILSCEGYFGLFAHKLEVGKSQQFAFSEDDDGSFWLPAVERQRRCDDIKTGVFKTTELSVKQLMIEINIKMPSMQMKDMKNKPPEDIKRLATGLDIALSKEEEVIKEKGWSGKAKGLLQVLWERGFIDETKKVSKFILYLAAKTSSAMWFPISAYRS